MSRLVAIFAAATAFVLACATSFATPIAPIPTASADHVAQVYYYHGHNYPYYYHGHYYHGRGWHHGHWNYW